MVTLEAQNRILDSGLDKVLIGQHFGRLHHNVAAHRLVALFAEIVLS